MKVMKLVSSPLLNAFLIQGKHKLAKSQIEVYNLSDLKNERTEFGANAIAEK